MSTNSVNPPHYILISHSSEPSGSNGAVKTLNHPSIQYHYADDPPLAVLPQSSDEPVIVLDYDLSGGRAPHAASLSGPAVVTGVSVTDAPGAVSESGENVEKMFVVQTTSFEDSPPTPERSEPQAILSRFRERNAVLRQVLDYQGPLSVAGQQENGSVD